MKARPEFRQKTKSGSEVSSKDGSCYYAETIPKEYLPPIFHHDWYHTQPGGL